ncbi:MAG: uracil-DNA glycosylase [Arenicella sp.]|jgi:uracil-DNA glycosylase
MPEVKTPPSLRNLYQELNTDLDVKVPAHGYLMNWAQQGVLLLNAVLTVEQGRAGSHQGKGWERFTNKVIEVIDAECDNVVFMLWGAYAQKKGASINTTKHLVLSAPHPSPLSAYRGFFGCRHFSMANDYLEDNGRAGIDWQIP